MQRKTIRHLSVAVACAAACSLALVGSAANADYSPQVATMRDNVASTMGPWTKPDYVVKDTHPAAAAVDITGVTVSQGLMTDTEGALGSEPFVTAKISLASASEFPLTPGNRLTAVFSWKETVQETVIHDEVQCHQETTTDRQTKRFRGRAAIARAIKNGWKRVPGAAVTANGTLMYRLVKHTERVCETVQVSEVVDVVKTRERRFATTAQAGGGDAQSVTDETGAAVTCDASWWSGLVGNDQDIYGPDLYAYYPTSCIPVDTFDVAFETNADRVATPGPVTVRSASDLRRAQGTFAHSVSPVDNAEPVYWTGTTTDTAVYDPVDQMVVLTQKFRGRAPTFGADFTGQFGWFFVPDGPVPGFGNEGGWRLLTASMGDDGQWQVSAGKIFLLPFGDDWQTSLAEYQRWSTCVSNTADFTYADGTMTFRLPVECLALSRFAGGSGWYNPASTRVATYNTPPPDWMDPSRTFKDPSAYSQPILLQ